MKRGHRRITSVLTSATLLVAICTTFPLSVLAKDNVPSLCSPLNKTCTLSTACESIIVPLSSKKTVLNTLFPQVEAASTDVFDYKKLVSPTPTIIEKKEIEPVHDAIVVTMPVVSPTTAPTVNTAPIPQSSSLNAEVVFDLINKYRNSIGLASFEKNDELCSLAASRGPELAGEVASGALHSGLYSRNLPYWVTENMKYGGDEQEVLRWWLNSPIHRAAIEGNYKYSCGVCVGDTCEQLFTNFVPK